MNIYYDVEDNHYRTYPDGDIATIDQMEELIKNKNLSILKLQQENEQLKEKLNCDLQWAFKYEKQVDNWNKLKEYIKTIYKGCPPYEKEVLMFITDKIQELEGSDINE